MTGTLDNGFLDIEAALPRIHGMEMSVRKRESPVHAVVAHLQIPRPPARSCAGHIQWIKDNWSVVEPAMMEMANQENPRTVR
jgi:hypothetical protein